MTGGTTLNEQDILIIAFLTQSFLLLVCFGEIHRLVGQIIKMNEIEVEFETNGDDKFGGKL